MSTPDTEKGPAPTQAPAAPPGSGSVAVEPSGFAASPGLAGGFASREQILALDDSQFEEVHVPEWNTTVRVRGLTGTERDAWEASLMRQEGRRQPRIDYSNLRAKLIVRSVVDANGNRMFSDGDMAALGKKSASALQRIFEVCQRLSRLTDEDVEELTGNSNGDRSADNGSGSPLISESP
jgi:hypothetical protein